MKKNLHLTHTDIETDSRILKEMGGLASEGYSVGGIGVELEEGAKKTAVPFAADIKAIRLQARSLKFLPRTLRHALTLCELLFRMLPRAVSRKPDIVHCHDTLVLPLGFLVKLLTGAQLVYDAHELESDRNGLTPVQGWLTLRAEKFLWRFIDALIVPSPSALTWYHDNIGPKPSSVIMNSPLFESGLGQQGDYLRKKFDIPDDRRIFIYVGIIGPGRGIDLILDVFTHPESHSHVVFMGFGEFEPKVAQLAMVHGNIHLHPAVPHAQVVHISQSADFGLCLIENVSLSDYYCLPNKLFEYIFAGVPVLSSDFPDLSAVVDEYNVGRTSSLEPDQVRKAIRELESSPQSFEFRDLTPLSWQAQEAKLLDLYQHILSTRQSKEADGAAEPQAGRP